MWKPPISRPSLIDVNYRGKTIKKGVAVWPIGTDTIKSTVFSRLKLIEPGPGYFHFPQIDEEYFEQLTAEKVVSTMVNGQHRRKWIQIRNRNEALDCLVYAYAAAVSVGIARIDWDKLESQLFPAITEEIEPTEREVKKPVKERSRRGSGFVKGW